MELLVKTPIIIEAATLADASDNPGSGSAGINPTGSDSGNFLSALTGGISKILENTNEGTKRTQKKKNLVRQTNAWCLLGAKVATGVPGGKISCPDALTP